MKKTASLDSSIIVRGFKGDKKTLRIYQLTYKRKFSLEEVELFLNKFKFLSTDEEIKNKSLEYINFYYFETT